jgi:hypothetical protein
MSRAIPTPVSCHAPQRNGVEELPVIVEAVDRAVHSVVQGPRVGALKVEAVDLQNKKFIHNVGTGNPQTHMAHAIATSAQDASSRQTPRGATHMNHIMM